MFSDGILNVLSRGTVVWFVIIFVESLHGIARRILIEPFLGESRARQVSVFIGSIIILAITFVFVRWLKAARIRDFLIIGIIWVGLTVSFEILLGRLAMGVSWERIAADYNLKDGGLMPLGLLVMLFAPLAMAKIVDEV